MYQSRQKLRESIVDSFSKEPDISAIFFFGKDVNNKTDDYSDIDMMLVSNNLLKTQQKYQTILSNISPIVGSYTLISTPDDLTQMVMLKDFSPYQKIDFSIVTDIESKKVFGPFAEVYTNSQSPTKRKTRLKIVKTNKVENQLYDYLFSIPRFTKCLFRKDYDMYRRWKGISDAVLSLFYEKYFGWNEDKKSKLSALEASQLYKVLNLSDKKNLDEIFPTSGLFNIAKSFQVCVNILIELSLQKAKYFRTSFSGEFINYITNFLTDEVKRHQQLGVK